MFIDEIEIVAHQEAVGAIGLEDVAPYLSYLADPVCGGLKHVDKNVSESLVKYINHSWGPHICAFLDRCRSSSVPSRRGREGFRTEQQST